MVSTCDFKKRKESTKSFGRRKLNLKGGRNAFHIIPINNGSTNWFNKLKIQRHFSSRQNTCWNWLVKKGSRPRKGTNKSQLRSLKSSHAWWYKKVSPSSGKPSCNACSVPKKWWQSVEGEEGRVKRVRGSWWEAAGGLKRNLQEMGQTRTSWRPES